MNCHKTPKLDVPKTQIISSALCNDFDGAIALHKDFIVQVSAAETTHNVLEVKTCGKDKNKWPREGPRRRKQEHDTQMLNHLKQVQVEEHCHKHAKFVKLSDDQQQKLGLLQEASESKGNNNNNSQVSSPHSKVDKLTIGMEHLAAATSMAEKAEEDPNDDDQSNNDSNRNNSALQPQRKNKGNGWNSALAFVEDKGIKVRGAVRKEVRFADAVVVRILKLMSSN